MKALLQKNGFIHYQSDIEYSNEDYQTLINEISFLEKDPYAPSKCNQKSKICQCNHSSVGR